MTYIWGESGSGLSEHAWRRAESSGAAWVGNDASAHISLLRPTVREELAFGMEQQAIPRDEMEFRVSDALDLWDLRDIADQKPWALSTGQTRRVAIAAALLGSSRGSRGSTPLVLDCPIDGLDHGAVETLRHALARFNGDVTIYDRVRTALAEDMGEQLRLHDGELTPCAAPTPELPEITPVSPGEVVLHCDLSATNGNFTLHASVTAHAGHVTHVAGPNGSGKTTLMLAILGLIPHKGMLVAPTSGWVPTAMDAAFSQRTVLKELMVGTDADHAEAALEWVGLGQWRDAHPLDVPSSARRMIAVAAAVARGPELLLVDEPTVGLDAPGHAWLARVLRGYAAGDYHRQLGSEVVRPVTAPAVLWTCHNSEFAAAISDRALMLT